MNFAQIIFNSDIEYYKTKIFELFDTEKYMFIDREYDGEHRIRIRGILGDENYISDILGKKNGFVFSTEPDDFFENIEQFILYCSIHNMLDKVWCKHYFANTAKLEDVIGFCKEMAENITVKSDEGYNSHFSHFWGFFHTLTHYQKTRILRIFQKKYQNIKITEYPFAIDIKTPLNTIEKMITMDKLNFFSPQSINRIVENGEFASKIHERTIRNAAESEFYKSKHYILNRWYLNALYVALMLMNIPVIDKYFINYVMAMEKYPVDEICEMYLKTGEEKLWKRENIV
nr:hypothetical protein [uncultured Catonella sp.]